MTNSAGTVVWAADYKPFGEATVTTATIENNLRFPGQYFDQETNLHYNYFRDYDPSTGRYVESDPIGLDGGINTYNYAASSPLNNFDADGRKPLSGMVCGIAALGYGGYASYQRISDGARAAQLQTTIIKLNNELLNLELDQLNPDKCLPDAFKKHLEQLIQQALSDAQAEFDNLSEKLKKDGLVTIPNALIAGAVCTIIGLGPI
jgi:RHS repeat-associated protein